MKAVILYPNQGLPQCVELPDPTVQNGKEVSVTVKAVAIKHLDKSKANGKHYSSDASKENSRVIGGDGACLLPDGTRVYGMAVSGMMAEKAIIDSNMMVPIPDGVNDLVAAALPNAVAGAAMALLFKADIQPGDVVLINGATGFTGRVAVQLAKHYGAEKVIATGRNQSSLNDLLSMGADEIISIVPDDDGFKSQLMAIHDQTPIDIVIDYLWGQPAELILDCLKGNGSFTNKIRFVSVGSMAGDIIQLSAANLRSTNIQLTGSGLGAWSKQQIQQFFKELLPNAFQLAAAGKLNVDTVSVKMENIADLWDLEVPNGQRLVVTI
ncbi:MULTISPECIES: quinone oxidoreductase family protein [Niastella]|uniref:Zinc-binding dehydrogenase n=1 Tax=Niastella soli TaxID=2821487 RepID=A0ABS3YSI1_9BACT|nr:zinc-binding dehydrogenase [Niastella soli]MBO9200858.1 zinc-binding dehydrogenase [Niastella soli]